MLQLDPQLPKICEKDGENGFRAVTRVIVPFVNSHVEINRIENKLHRNLVGSFSFFGNSCHNTKCRIDSQNKKEDNF
jgi:hypothetical protein